MGMVTFCLPKFDSNENGSSNFYAVFGNKSVFILGIQRVSTHNSVTVLNNLNNLKTVLQYHFV